MHARVTLITGIAAIVIAGSMLSAQFQFDPDRVIPGGGIFVSGWTGKIDPASVRQGRSLNDSKLAQEGGALHVIAGPATTYWNPANTASGDYTVKATFTEPRFMELNSHPHSYGIFIGGTDMGTDQMSLVYCVAYGSGEMLVRGFSGPSVFTLLRQSPNPAVHKAPGVGKPVTQDSGSEPDFLAMATKLGAVRSLPKPFRPAALLATLAECLAAAREPSAQPTSDSDVASRR